MLFKYGTHDIKELTHLAARLEIEKYLAYYLHIENKQLLVFKKKIIIKVANLLYAPCHFLQDLVFGSW